jgi:hypothetical protein
VRAAGLADPGGGCVENGLMDRASDSFHTAAARLEQADA